MKNQPTGCIDLPMPAFAEPEICRSILETLESGVSVVDLQKKIVFWSNGAERITGFLRHEVVGRACLANILPHCNGQSCESCVERCPVEAAIHNAKPAEAIGFLHHKTGRLVSVHLWVTPVRDAHDSIIGTAHSFTEQHQAVSPGDRQAVLQAPGCTDAVTGTPNHAMMWSHLRETLAIFDDLQFPFSILLVRFRELELFRASYTREATASLLR